MKIAIEGMDGVGKTEIAKYISDKFNFEFVDKPLHHFYEDGPEKEYADLMKAASTILDIKDSRIRSWYIALGNVYAISQFENNDVVIDRHIVSNYYWNGDELSEIIFETLISMIGRPDLTILLYATPKTRIKRLKKRDPNDPDLLDLTKHSDGLEKMVTFMDKYEIPNVIVNTEELTLEQVKHEVDIIIEKLFFEKMNKHVLKKNNCRRKIL